MDCELSSVPPSIRAISSSIVKSPPALHLGNLGEIGTPFDEPLESLAVCDGTDGGAGGALGAM
jgi:hypothetical protein